MDRLLERIEKAGRRCSMRIRFEKDRMIAAASSTQGIALAGVILLTAGLGGLAHAQDVLEMTHSPASFDEGLISAAVGNLFRLVEGAFGALVMVVAGIGAIVSAAMGAYRAAVGMMVVAVGSFILRSLVSLFFGIEYEPYDA